MDSEGRKYKSRSQPPCDACRKRRICCVRLPGSPDCALCQTRSASCTYETVPVPKRGRAPSQRYLRLRERRASSSAAPVLGPAQGRAVGGARVILEGPTAASGDIKVRRDMPRVDMSRSISTTSTTATAEMTGMARMARMAGVAGVAGMAAMTGTSTTPQTGQPTVGGNTAAVTGQTSFITQFLGLSGDQDPFVMRRCSFDSSSYNKQVDWSCLRVSNSGTEPAHFTMVPDDTYLDVRPEPYPALDVARVLAEDHYCMLTAYVDVVHISFPLLDSGVLSQLTAVKTGGFPAPHPQNFDMFQFQTGIPSTPSPNIDPLQKTEPSNLLLAAMCCLAAPFSKNKASASVATAQTDLGRFVFEALAAERRHPRIEAVEAALIFLQRLAHVHRAPTTTGLWAEMGNIVGMCHDIGLNVDPTDWNITLEHRNRRIRLWWATYTFEVFSAFGLGRPSYIHGNNCNVPPLSLEHFDAADIAVPLASRAHFVSMAALATLLSRLLVDWYSLAAVESLRNAQPVNITVLFVAFRQQLRAFRTAHIDNIPSMAGAFLDSTGTLILSFHAVEIGLCRAALRYLDPNSPDYMAVRRYAKTAVEAVIDMLRRLQVNQLRAYWWNPLSEIHFSLAGSFLFFLLLSSTDDAEIQHWSIQIKEYRQLLELESFGFTVTRLAANRMALLASANERSFAKSVDLAGEEFDSDAMDEMEGMGVMGALAGS